MKKKIFSAVLILVLLFTATVSASAQSIIQPQDTNSVIFVTNRTGRTTADVAVSISFSGYVDHYDVYLYLQKKVNGQWLYDFRNEDYSFSYSGSGIDEFLFGKAYTDLSEGVTYRIQCVSKDKINGASYSFTSYSKQF